MSANNDNTQKPANPPKPSTPRPVKEHRDQGTRNPPITVKPPK